MPKFKFSKLVRDKIVANQLKEGAKPSYRVLTDEQHIKELINKIIEEAREIIKADTDVLTEEIADVQQAIDDLIYKTGLTKTDIKKAQITKRSKNGAFKKGHFIEYIELDNENKWTEYYRANPDRYPEL